MSKYEVIIYWSKDDEAFIAEVPELSAAPPTAQPGKPPLKTWTWSSRSGLPRPKSLAGQFPNQRPPGFLLDAYETNNSFKRFEVTIPKEVRESLRRKWVPLTGSPYGFLDVCNGKRLDKLPAFTYMIPEKVFHQILGLGETWRVSRVDYVEKESKVLIRVEDTPALWRRRVVRIARPSRGRYDHAPERSWRHLNVCQLESEIVCFAPARTMQGVRRF